MAQFSGLDKLLTGISIALILLWLFFVARYIRNLLNEYTLKDWGAKENPYKYETLGLPRGTLRGVLTLTLLVVVVILVCASMVVKPLRGGFDSLIDAFQVMLAFYFGSKVMHHVTNSDKKKTMDRNKAEAEKARFAAAAESNSSTEVLDDFHDKDAVG